MCFTVYSHLTRAAPPLSPLHVPAWLSVDESAQNKGSLQNKKKLCLLKQDRPGQKIVTLS